MIDVGMTIDGARVSGAGGFSVRNPATEEELSRAPACSGEQLDAAVASGKRAFASWKRDEAARRAALLKAAELVEGQGNELARLLTLEQGKPLAHATAEGVGRAPPLTA